MTGLGRTWRALPDLLAVSAAEIAAWRAELILWVLTATLPLIQAALWDTVAADGPVAGFDRAGLSRYFAATLLVRQLTASWVVWALNGEIRSGSLSVKLLKPIHPLWQYAAQMGLALPLRLAVLAPILAAWIAWRPALWRWPAPQEWAAFLVSVALAWAIAFLVQAWIATAAFWLDKTDALWGLWFACWMVASGYTAPMATLPPAAAAWARWGPFYATLGAPVEILAGCCPDPVAAIATQAVWAGGLLWLTRATWRAGVRRYGAFGA